MLALRADLAPHMASTPHQEWSVNTEPGLNPERYRCGSKTTKKDRKIKGTYYSDRVQIPFNSHTYGKLLQLCDSDFVIKNDIKMSLKMVAVRYK